MPGQRLQSDPKIHPSVFWQTIRAALSLWGEQKTISARANKWFALSYRVGIHTYDRQQSGTPWKTVERGFGACVRLMGTLLISSTRLLPRVIDNQVQRIPAR